MIQSRERLSDRDELASVTSSRPAVLHSALKETGAPKLPSGSRRWSGSLPSLAEPRSTRKHCSQSEPREERLSVPQDNNREVEWDLLLSAGPVIEARYILSSDWRCLCWKHWSYSVRGVESKAAVHWQPPAAVIRVSQNCRDAHTCNLTCLKSDVTVFQISLTRVCLTEGHEHRWTDPLSVVSVYRVFFPLRTGSGHVINTERLKTGSCSTSHKTSVCQQTGASLNSRGCSS